MIAGREKMIAALQSLQRNFEPVDPRAASLDTLKIPARGFIALFSTHPPIEERIEALRNANL
jgi:heat shock protein HtpX